MQMFAVRPMHRYSVRWARLPEFGWRDPVLSAECTGEIREIGKAQTPGDLRYRQMFFGEHCAHAFISGMNAGTGVPSPWAGLGWASLTLSPVQVMFARLRRIYDAVQDPGRSCIAG
jgi:hypothetical protein